jgi:Flp pilus assembly protein TadG
MRTNLKSLLRHSSGNVTVMFSLVIIPVLLAAGSAIDYMRFNDARTSVQSALDGAALAAALPAEKTDDERIAIAQDFFRNNLSYRRPDGSDIEVDVTINADTVAAAVSTEVPTSFMRLAGIETMALNEITEVMRPFEGTAEVVLVLDYSGSMNRNRKYQDMSAAATSMVNSLDSALEDGKLKVGLVPFSAMVYTSMSGSYVNQGSGLSSWTGCTQDRSYPHNTNVDTPTADAATKWGYIDGNGENSGQYQCTSYDNKNLKILPLTTNMTTVKSKLSSMRPLGNTNIPLGAEFGWNLLDPQLPFDEAAAYTDPQTRKFLVLLTDGVQTSSEFGVGGDRSVPHANENLLELCSNMRGSGITVFAIAYDITNPAVTDLLEDCAPGRYYEPDAGGGEINQVFSQITRQIKNRIARVSR